MIECIFLDLDDTILDFHRSEAIAIRKTLQTLLPGGEVTDETVALYSRINASLWRRLERGEVGREELRSLRFEMLFAELGVGASAQMAMHLYDRHLSTGHYFIDGAPQLLQTLARSYPLYLASNGRRAVQDKRLDSAGIRRYFKDIFLSEDMGADKPSHAYFDACFARIPNLTPSRAILLGDSLTSDILGGNDAGMITCLFNPSGRETTGEIRPTYEISALSQFYAVIEDFDAKNP